MLIVDSLSSFESHILSLYHDRIVFTGPVMLGVSTAPNDVSKNFRGSGHDPYPAAKGARTQKL